MSDWPLKLRSFSNNLAMRREPVTGTSAAVSPAPNKVTSESTSDMLAVRVKAFQASSASNQVPNSRSLRSSASKPWSSASSPLNQVKMSFCACTLPISMGSSKVLRNQPTERLSAVPKYHSQRASRLSTVAGSRKTLPR